ncbi:DUF748 domain-containing protein [Desulfoluna butyratoxydans]|uniref:DUF748 domain-containing protein n=1 Tax=Desulfoluna butyratoxydans TaxID=231438 RepID=A0A4U8YXZ3_9BACT|nr:DUF748 domain-containing protein [Desulfoluna butyratoxydans]VFQ46343.1 protein of unknown function duf748 [Desulfoluna butyratoxydans]
MKQLRQIKSTVKSRGGIITSVSALVILLFVSAVPFAIKHGALFWLTSKGMEARIDNVDVNLFAGTLVVEGVHLRAQSGEASSLERFGVNLAMTDLVRKRLRIQSLHIDGLDLMVRQDTSLMAGGFPISTGEPHAEPPARDDKESKTPWHVGVDTFTARNTSVNLSLPKLDLVIALEDASLTGLSTWKPEQVSRLEITGALNKSPLLVSLDLVPFGPETSVQGGVQLTDFALSPFSGLAAPRVAALEGELTVDTRFTITQAPEAGTTLSQTGTLSLSHVGGHLTDPAVTLRDAGITWLGDVWVALDKDGTLTDLRTLGSLSNGKLDIAYPEGGIRLRHEGIVWDGELSFDPSRKDGLAARGNLSVRQALASDSETDVKIASLAHFFAYDIKAKGLADIRVPHISLKKLAALPPLSEIGSVDITGMALEELSHLRAETFIIDDVVTTLVRDPSGRLTFFNTLNSLTAFHWGDSAPAPSEAEVPNTPPPAPRPIVTAKINTFRISGSPFLHLTDRSVRPVFEKGVTLKRLEIQNIDTADPDKDLPLSLVAELDTYETLSVTGTVRPLAHDVSAHLEARVANINLSSLSPYSSQALGYLIKRGSFTADSTLDIDAGILDVRNQLTLRNLKLVPDDEDTAHQTMKNLSMPLDYALSILEDGNGTISLSIPVHGDIHNPDISLNSIIQVAMTKAITTASVSYLSFLLQPYGALLMVAEKAGEMVTEIHLDSVGYALGATEPNPEGLEYLKVVAGLMKKKEFLNLTVCANAVAEDLVTPEAPHGETPENADAPEAPEPPARERYLDLAQQRGRAIRHILAKEGIAPGRIHVCRPDFTVSAQKQPEAELTL